MKLLYTTILLRNISTGGFYGSYFFSDQSEACGSNGSEYTPYVTERVQSRQMISNFRIFIKIFKRPYFLYWSVLLSSLKPVFELSSKRPTVFGIRLRILFSSSNNLRIFRKSLEIPEIVFKKTYNKFPIKICLFAAY